MEINLDKIAKALRNPSAESVAQLGTEDFRAAIKLATDDVRKKLRVERKLQTDARWRAGHRQEERDRFKAYYAEKRAEMSEAEKTAAREKERGRGRRRRATA